jgi:hypothetical protein
MQSGAKVVSVGWMAVPSIHHGNTVVDENSVIHPTQR